MWRYNPIANPRNSPISLKLMGENITGLSTRRGGKTIAAITRLSMDIGIPQHLRDLGQGKRGRLPLHGEMALKDGNAFSNPRKGNEQEIAAILRQAF